MDIKLSNNSAITCKKFETIEELAETLVPALTAGSVGISGGSTYTKLFKAWASIEMDLSNSWFCAVDERVVPFDDPDSNWGTAGRELFIPKRIPEQNNNHYNSIGFFRTLLRNRFDTEPYIFDTIFLGVGDDGHTASLFPGTPHVDDYHNNVLATRSPKGVAERVTMGARLIRDAKEVITVLTGEGKEQCVEWLVKGDMGKPFVSILAKRKNSTLYLDPVLYKRLESLLS